VIRQAATELRRSVATELSRRITLYGFLALNFLRGDAHG